MKLYERAEYFWRAHVDLNPKGFGSYISFTITVLAFYGLCVKPMRW